MNWVYSSGTEKPKLTLVAEEILPEIVDDAEYLEVCQSSVVLTIFRAEVDVKLSRKMSEELHRATKKNTPRALKYELIYVCHLPTPATWHANMAFRRGRMSTTRVGERMTPSPGQRVVFSKDCVRTWMGESISRACIPLLTLVQVWLRSCVYCRSCYNCNGVTSHFQIGTCHWANDWYWRTHVRSVYTHCRARVHRSCVSNSSLTLQPVTYRFSQRPECRR